ncbi:MAG: hypothetical protein IPO88_15330 [Nannocystis sp.]|uniref:ABC transporter substrate-binding protein n=1 Tax=Nannocystis sp. TaxID=1962667 RepID=UPI0024224E8A|nr:ABC transporter substrate-binding protein [Nannocystis sp.]MBK9754838.1 hypothetical protein [Nannocystis sp.]
MPLAPAGPLRLALETPIPTLDPAAASDTVSRRITSQIFDTLLDWDPAGTSLRPELLAQLPVISDDGLTITMTLRSGPDARRFAADTCLEGQPRRVRASDVAASLLRIDPARHAAYALLADRIVGLDEHHRTRATVPGIRADDASNTITLQLTRPQPELPAILASPMLAIVPPECIAYYDGRDLEHPPFARHPVGSGPYVLDHARSELPREVLLLRSPEAPASDGLAALGCPQLPGASPVALTHFHDPEPALRSFQAGELAAIAPGQSQFAELVADPSTRGAALNQSQLADPSAGRLRPGAAPPGSQLLRFPTLATDLLVFRMRDPELGQHPDPAIDAQHRALRQAVALAFDAVRYQRVIRNDAWATQRARIVPKGLGGALDDAVLHRFAPPAADLPQARQILAAADIVGPRVLRYWTGTDEAEAQEAAILRDALRPLGIDLQVTRRAHYLGEVLAGSSDAQLFALRYDADYLDPASFLAPFTCAAPDNYSGFCDPAYDLAFAAFTRVPPGPARDQAAAALERQLGDQVPVRPIDQPEAWYVVQPWLQGVTRHPLAGLRIELLCPRTRE